VLRVIEAFVDDGWVVAEFGGRRGLAPCPYLSSVPTPTATVCPRALCTKLCMYLFMCIWYTFTMYYILYIYIYTHTQRQNKSIATAALL
jgi:hypothetical protein